MQVGWLNMKEQSKIILGSAAVPDCAKGERDAYLVALIEQCQWGYEIFCRKLYFELCDIVRFFTGRKM